MEGSVEIPLHDDVAPTSAAAEETPTAATAAVPESEPSAPSVSEPGLFSYVFGVVSQQLLEEIGQAKSSESEENAAIVKELEELRVDCLSLEELLLNLGSSYLILHGAVSAFGEQLYQLGIKEEAGLRSTLLETGELTRGVAKELNLQPQLEKIASSVHQQVKAIADARETREVYRIARLAFDKAERSLNDAKKGKKSNVDVLQKDRDAAFGRYQELAQVMKSKVMLLHQFRIRTLNKQLDEVQKAFSQAWTTSAEKIPASRSESINPEANHSVAMQELLEQNE